MIRNYAKQSTKIENKIIFYIYLIADRFVDSKA